MENDDNLFGFGQEATSSQGSAGKSAAGINNSDDPFSSLATRHALSQESSAIEFDPFGDNLWKNTSEQDPFDLSSLTTPTTTTSTLTNTTSSTPELSDDFADLLNFDTCISTTTPTLTKATNSELFGEEKQLASASSLFSDLDPLSPTVKTEQSISLQPTLCEPEDDLFEVKTTTKADPFDVKPANTTDPFEVKTATKADPFDTKPANRADPFEVKTAYKADPFDVKPANTADPFELKTAYKADLFKVNPVNKSDIEQAQEDDDLPLGGKKKNESDIFESMKADSTDPFSMDPFSNLTRIDTPLETSDPPATNKKTTSGNAWLESLTSPQVTAPPGEIPDQANELETGNQTADQVDELDTDVTMTEEETPVISLPTDKQAEKMAEDEKTDNNLDFSVIEDTAHLDIEALKQKSSLRKKGSLALRRKPSRKGVRDSLLKVVDQFQEIESSDGSSRKATPTTSNEAPEVGSSGVPEKHDVEKPENENKPSHAERPSVLRKGAGKAPPGGQIVIPGLADIGKVKLRKSPLNSVAGSNRPASIASGLTQPVSIPKVQLKNSQRSSLILPKPASTTTTTSTANRAGFHSLFSKPQLQTKPTVAAQKPNISETKDASLKKDGKPSWLRDAKKAKMAPGSEELSVKHQQEKEPEKPAWIKASIEKRQKSTDSITKEVETKSNKENNLPSTSRSEKVNKDLEISKTDTDQSSENRLNELNYLQTQKSSTQSSTEASPTVLLIENTVTKSLTSRLCVSDLSLNKNMESSNKNGHTTTDDQEEVVVRRPKLSPRPDYIPSWSNQGNKVLPGVETEENNQSTGELPKWKRDILERRKSKPADVSQVDSPAKESPSIETTVPAWQKELQNRRRSSIKQKEPVSESQSSKQPEWMRKAEERRARLAKSGLMEK